MLVLYRYSKFGNATYAQYLVKKQPLQKIVEAVFLYLRLMYLAYEIKHKKACRGGRL